MKKLVPYSFLEFEWTKIRLLLLLFFFAQDKKQKKNGPDVKSSSRNP